MPADHDTEPVHPWRTIDLDVYEQHMSDDRVGQLRLLHDLTRQQLSAYPARSVAILGIAGGNGLDLIDPVTTEAVYGYDVNPAYLAACASRHGRRLGRRLHLVETMIDRTVRIEPVDLVIANLIVEYVGVAEFAAFLAANARDVGAVSCVTQRNDAADFVSATAHTSSFDALATISNDVVPEALADAMASAGFVSRHRSDHPLPNGKTLVRQDFGAPGVPGGRTGGAE